MNLKNKIKFKTAVTVYFKVLFEGFEFDTFTHNKMN